MKHIVSLVAALTACSAIASPDQKLLPMHVGETWQVAANAPAGWLSRGFKVKEIAPYPKDAIELYNYSEQFKNSVIAFYDESSRKMALVWEQSTPEFPEPMLLACISPRLSNGMNEWVGILRLYFGDSLGTCHVKKSKQPISRPNNLSVNPLGLSNPFQSSQIWKVSLSGKVQRSKVFTINNLNRRSNQGRFSSYGSAVGFEYNKLQRTAKISWDIPEGLVFCDLVGISETGRNFGGQYSFRDEKPVGTCQLTRIK